MNDLIFPTAIRKASELRIKLNQGLFNPVNVFEICSELELDVRFTDINMEGLYVYSPSGSKIFLSCLRPFPRRAFTCAHELGHHLFNHGSKADSILGDRSPESTYDDDELLADTFAAALLIPVGGIQTAFLKRSVEIAHGSPLDYFKISSEFGVGYLTLITQCRISRLISEQKSIELLRTSPGQILKSEFPGLSPLSHFRIIDEMSEHYPIDLEVGNYLWTPRDVSVDERHLRKKAETRHSILFEAMAPGVTAVSSRDGEYSHFVRTQRSNYQGMAEYRHLEN